MQPELHYNESKIYNYLEKIVGKHEFETHNDLI
jgi:hypothetical protein